MTEFHDLGEMNSHNDFWNQTVDTNFRDKIAFYLPVYRLINEIINQINSKSAPFLTSFLDLLNGNSIKLSDLNTIGRKKGSLANSTREITGCDVDALCLSSRCVHSDARWRKPDKRGGPSISPCQFEQSLRIIYHRTMGRYQRLEKPSKKS